MSEGIRKTHGYETARRRRSAGDQKSVAMPALMLDFSQHCAGGMSVHAQFVFIGNFWPVEVSLASDNFLCPPKIERRFM
jgi:hypothetical protein